MKFKKLAAVLMLVIFITGCRAGLQVPETPQDKSTFFMSYYMAQLKDYNARYNVAEAYGSTELEQSILEAKYAFLMNAWYPIAAYEGYVSNGEVPPPELEDQINSFITMLENRLKEVENE